MKKIKIGEVGVDSGQLIITDPCYIDSQWKKEKLEQNKDGSFKPAKNNFSYPAVCNITLKNPSAGQLNYKMGHPGVAVAFCSGYGDGTYPVYATLNAEGRYIKVEIDCGITDVQAKFFTRKTKQTTHKQSLLKKKNNRTSNKYT